MSHLNNQRNACFGLSIIVLLSILLSLSPTLALSEGTGGPEPPISSTDTIVDSTIHHNNSVIIIPESEKDLFESLLELISL